MEQSPVKEKARVLIVDDEAVMRDSLSEWLAEAGFEPVAVESGHAALEYCARQPFDVAVVDLKMPGMDGITLLKKLHDMGKDFPIIMITAYGTIETAVQAMKEGAYDYITKPFPPEKLTYMLRRVVEHRRLQAENIRLQKERRTFFHIVLGVVINLIILLLIFLFLLK